MPALQARMIVNRLRASGVETADVGAEPIYGSLNFAEGAQIWVADDELAVAGQVLSEVDDEQ